MHQSCLWQRPVTDEELAWFAVLGHALSDGVRFEADLGERSHPNVAIKQSASVGLVTTWTKPSFPRSRNAYSGSSDGDATLTKQ